MSGDYEPYIVKQGDYLTQLASRFGFDPHVVWSHPDNSSLKSKRHDPNQLAPLDVLYFPRSARRWFSTTAGENTFTAKVTLVTISLRFTDSDGAMKGMAYTVEGADIAPGNLTDDGLFQARVPSSLSEFILVLPNRRHVVRVGHLDPINTASGVIQRLAHLGYLRPEVPQMEDEFYAGLARFRADKKITTIRKAGSDGLDAKFKDVQSRDYAGTLSTDTLAALLSAHGS